MGLSDLLLMLLMVVVPYLVGMSPALMPAAVPMSVRWGVLVLLLLSSIWVQYRGGPSPHGFELLILVPLWAGLVVGTVLLAKRHTIGRGD